MLSKLDESEPVLLTSGVSSFRLGNLADFNKQVDKLGESVSQTLAKKLTAGFSDGMKRNVKTLESLGARVATQVQNINKIWNSEKNVADYLTGSDKGKAINLLGVNKQRTISNRTAQIEAIDQAGVISSEKYKDNLEEIARLESEITKEEQKAAEVREKANIIKQMLFIMHRGPQKGNIVYDDFKISGEVGRLRSKNHNLNNITFVSQSPTGIYFKKYKL